MLEKQFVPLPDGIKGWSLVYLKDMNNTMCILEVGRNQTPVSLLSSCVPHLQSVVLPVPTEILDIEIDSNGVLRLDESTLWFSSYKLVVYLSIILVFPTPVSPKNTNLNFVVFLLLFDEVRLIYNIVWINHQTHQLSPYTWAFTLLLNFFLIFFNMFFIYCFYDFSGWFSKGRLAAVSIGYFFSWR